MKKHEEEENPAHWLGNPSLSGFTKSNNPSHKQPRYIVLWPYINAPPHYFTSVQETFSNFFFVYLCFFSFVQLALGFLLFKMHYALCQFLSLVCRIVRGLHLQVNRDPCFQTDQSLLVWSAPEYRWAFTPAQRSRLSKETNSGLDQTYWRPRNGPHFKAFLEQTQLFDVFN